MSLRTEVLHSLKWLAAARFLGQTILWAITLVVIRLLSPEDYGLMALATVMIGFAELFREMGLYSAMVQRRDLTQREIEQSFGLLIIGNGCIYALLFAGAPGIALFFGDERLTTMIRVLGLQFPLAAVGVVQDAMLSRSMKFKAKSFVNFAAMMSNGAFTLTFALLGYGVWALVFGSLAGAVVRPVGLLLVVRHRCRPRFSVAGMGQMSRFGGYVTASRVLWYFYSRADIFIVGKLLGHEILGFYAVSLQLASMPMQKLSGLINQVGLAAYSSVQADIEIVRAHYLKVVRLISFFAFPVFFGLSSVAPELVSVVLGVQWEPAILPLQLLTLVMPLRMISNAGSPALEAIGKPEIGTGNLVIASVIMPPAFLLGTVMGGLTGVSIAWVIAFPVLVLLRLRRSLPPIGVRISEYFLAISRPAFGATVMYGAVVVARESVATLLPNPILGLIFLIGIGALVYAALMGGVYRRESREVFELVRR
ncbi:polysaccharide biosynthesis protein [Salinisphaera dokdonensis CL-ES53]|uniref:Polysaccharide biosynthesis protein n=1 Tax=Salinisphaera dokdonensis CL-ES53 TaxID=1304272 RepID=A0ABV2B461_9GAMM